MLKTILNTGVKLETRIDPALILKSELIELPLLELENRISTELSTNPFLEEIESREDNLSDNDDDNEQDLEWEEIVKDFSNYEDNYYNSQDKNREKVSLEAITPSMTTLQDSLENQLHFNDFSEPDKIIAKEIIGNIDNNGYLCCPLYEIQTKLQIENLNEIEKVLKKVQQLEPKGVGARTIQEALIIQLTNQELYIEDSLIVLRDYYDYFMQKKYKYIMDRTGITKEQMEEIIEEITLINPKPGTTPVIESWEKDANNDKVAIIPDFFVREMDGKLQVFPNSTNIPRLNINTAYSQAILSSDTEKNTKNFVKKKLESARWFINAIYQRKITLKKVMQSIVKFQENFFLEGPEHLKPLILKNIANDIEMDIATISRCTRNKYVDTEFGIYELKYFFSERLSNSSGEDLSATVIKNKIEDLINNENKAHPLSDQKISQIIQKDGTKIARRTVQKYREQLGFPSTRMRKNIFINK